VLLSLPWLRELCPFEAEATRVAEALTARGLTVDALTGGPNDAVLDVDVPANRPDCLGHLGVARELAAAFGVPLATRKSRGTASGDDIGKLVTVTIEDPDLCARYTARVVRGVRVGPSPAWVVARLEACGLRSINNVVDASNLVLLETGHPIHTFDLALLEGGAIVVRRARSGERITTLDGVERSLAPGMLLIADSKKPVAIGGVMGGAGSEIVETTRDVLIEAAWFLPRSVRATSKALGLRTDASHRFERGADPEGVLAAQDRAQSLIVELARGTPAAGTVDAWPERPPQRRIEVKRARVGALLGYEPSDGEVEDALARLGLAPKLDGKTSLSIAVPSWRVDLERDVDVVEEIARHLGYDRIPAHIRPGAGAPAARDWAHRAEERIRARLPELGFLEAFCYSMIAAQQDDAYVALQAPRAIAVTNPIAEPLAKLRRSLLPGLVALVDLNSRRGTKDVRLFELGRVFLATSQTFPHEARRLGFAWTGAATAPHYRVAQRAASLADAAGLMESLLAAVRPGAALRRMAPEGPAPAAFHPGKVVLWLPEGGPAAFDRAVAWVAALHPGLARAMGLDGEVLLGELDLDLLAASPGQPRGFASIPRVPAVTRDLSLVLPEDTAYARVEEALRAAAAPAPARFDLVDRYQGPPLAAGEVSITVRVILQPLDRTLTDAEVEEYRGRLVRLLGSKLGLKLRE